MLELKNICVSFRSERQDKVFGHTRQQVLFDVSLNVKRGTCLGILGESGSGKSTMGRVLCGLLKPDSGEAILDGVSVYASRAGRRNLQNKLSVVFQDYTTSANPRFRVKEIIAEGLAARERNQKIRLNRLEEINRLLELVGLNSSYANRYPHELSGGQLQRVLLGRSIVSRPQVLILDEPNSYVDKRFESHFYKLLDEINKESAVILVSHDIGTVLAMVKNIACVNETLHYHPGADVSEEWLGEKYACPIELIGHGDLPHRVLKKHEHE